MGMIIHENKKSIPYPFDSLLYTKIFVFRSYGQQEYYCWLTVAVGISTYIEQGFW